MEKDFTKWHEKKSGLHQHKGTAFFHEREVWWCSLGENIGYEQDGNGEDFARPVVVIKKHNLDVCLVVPLTGKQKSGQYYFPINLVNGTPSSAILSQIRLIDRKRLLYKIETIQKQTFRSLVEELIRVNFGDLKW